MNSRTVLWNEDSGIRMFVSTPSGFAIENDTDAFERYRSDRSARRWLVAGYKQFLIKLQRQGRVTPFVKEITSIVRKGISILCLRFPQNDWPEIHRLRKEEMTRDSDA